MTSEMQEAIKNNRILTINDVASILRCSTAHVSPVLAGKVTGIRKLTHIAMGRRNLIRFDESMETNRRQ
ncbi:MAG: hypothetical protein KJZ78_20735 [Bryobacteraceae bacterium]|nr:hypothetical protein [Bryobacteraceae bacterium]